jgi:predicted nucleic acid-binding protein
MTGSVPVLVDTSVWVDHLGGYVTRQAQALRALMIDGRVVVGDLILLEVLQGIRTDVQFARTRRTLLELPVVSLCSPEIALVAAQNFRTLRARGYTIRTSIDCLIATFCIENGHELLHSDRDYVPFEEHLGLKRAAV